METKYTPGPRTETLGGFTVEVLKPTPGERVYNIRTVKPHNAHSGVGKHVATVNPAIECRYPGTANVLAAAPDLAEALKSMLWYYDQTSEAKRSGATEQDDVAQARAALAKAGL